MNPVPTRLRQEPLIEAIWQIQFETPAIGDVLPGVLFSELKTRYPNLSLSRLPAADIPAPVAQIDPNLRFVAKVMMEESGSPFRWQVGDRVVTLNCRKPYVGWKSFKEEIVKLVAILQKSGLVSNIQRHSLRYLDLLTLAPPPDLTALQLKVELGDHEIKQHNCQIRLEIPVNSWVHVVQIVTPAKANLPDEVLEGTLVDLETLSMSPPADLQQALQELEDLHGQSKDIFFRQILTASSIEKMRPEYEQ